MLVIAFCNVAHGKEAPRQSPSPGLFFFNARRGTEEINGRWVSTSKIDLAERHEWLLEILRQ